MVFKQFFLLVFILSGQMLIAQVNDSFTNGNFTVNPMWNGDAVDYEVDASFMLHLNAPVQTDTSYLSIPSEAINNATWEFFVQMTFNPSSGNYSKVYLVSDQANLKGNLSGYFIKIGNTADEISLYRQDGLAETKIVDGFDGRVNTNPVNVAVKVTRDNVGNWEVLSDVTGGTTYVSEGNVLDNTYVYSSFFGVSSRYSSTRSTRFYYDNFMVTGNGFVDNVAPVLDSLVVVNSTQIDAFFDEPVDLTIAETLSNYVVNLGVNNPYTVIRDAVDFSTVHLIFGTPFTNGQSYNLTITNVEDTLGNSIATIVDPFTYIVLGTPNVNDVVINEIFADPSPQIGLPTEEFVELYNSSNSIFELNNWKFINSTTVKILPNFILQPNAHVILCDVDDVALYASFGDVIGISTFSALANGGDSLSLLDNNNNLINVVKYDVSWYKDNVKDDGGWTLERINPLHPCSSANNWIASIDVIGGSPGSQNSVFDILPDVQPPIINDIHVFSSNQLNVFFNETMNSTALSGAIYTLAGGLSVTNVAVNSDNLGVLLTVNSELDSSAIYTLAIAGAADCSGNLLNTNTINFGIGKAPKKYEVVINELFADPSPTNGLPTEDYLELFNNSNKIIDLTGCIISDLTSMDILNAGKILPGEHVVICDNNFENQFTSFGKVITVNSFPSLNNGEDRITLYAPDTTLIHQVHYFDSWYRDENKKDGGWSIEMIDPNNPCAEESNWMASTHWVGGTPGTQNTVFGENPDVVFPLLSTANALNDSTVIVTYSEIIDEGGMLAAIYAIDNSVGIFSVEVLDNENVQLNLSNKLLFQIRYTVMVAGAFDCVGNTMGNNNKAVFALPQQGFYDDVVLNEVLFNPYTGASDFVEIYNNSNKFIDLQNWSLANLDNDSIDNYKTITTNPQLLLPGEFVVLTTNPQGVIDNYYDAVPTAILKMTSLPTYSNDAGNVYLINNLNVVVDSFYYDEDMHYPLLVSAKGVSLERIDYNRSSNDATNWHSAAESVNFATPGYENSQHLIAGDAGGEITISPETFSPDNDGFDDVVNINYRFPQGGLVAKIVIYDSKGRLIKKLVSNELLGVSGTFSWNGVNENNEKAKIGIYIIYFETFDTAGNVNSYKNTCVLAGRL